MKRDVVVWVDDLTDEPAAERVVFGLDNVDYSIDLTAGNAAALREALGPWVSVSRRTGGRRRPGTPTPAMGDGKG